ncbi:Antitoxin of toxin-antitoxin stability system [Bordetella ansorpii]|uniref:Antitoxin of toxin-antitoxin stability system n=1 Tax=Bordetella ansorpii TaxID=288768 RepID=A0A157QMF2_9BORD|nr:Antitoxin of toxin-antitoxin stability system [Bordetella ansorpii]
MEEVVSSADANRDFSRILRAVRAGTSYVVTSYGCPVARILPFDTDEKNLPGARTALISRLDDQPVIDIGGWRSEDLYGGKP